MDFGALRGAGSVAALIAWKLGSSSTTAHTITAIAERHEFAGGAAGRVGVQDLQREVDVGQEPRKAHAVRGREDQFLDGLVQGAAVG